MLTFLGMEPRGLEDCNCSSRVVDDRALVRATDGEPFAQEAVAVLEELLQSVTLVARIPRVDQDGQPGTLSRNEAILAGQLVRLAKLHRGLLQFCSPPNQRPLALLERKSAGCHEPGGCSSHGVRRAALARLRAEEGRTVLDLASDHGIVLCSPGRYRERAAASGGVGSSGARSARERGGVDLHPGVASSDWPPAALSCALRPPRFDANRVGSRLSSCMDRSTLGAGAAERCWQA
jgi:hypothetical protein